MQQQTHPSKLSRWIRVWALPVVWLVVQPMTAIGETPVTLRMKNGQSISGDLVSVGEHSVTYKLQGGTASLSQVYADIQTIDFPEPDLWMEGQEAFDSGDLAGAMDAFSKLTGSGPAVTFFPAPGNYHTRAQRRLVDCYRRQRNAKAIAKTLTEIEWSKLPPGEQKDIPVLKLWSALGGDNPAEASKIAAEMDAGFPIEDPAFPEFSYIRGKLAARAGANAEALRHFGACYGLPTPDTSLASDAIKESITLLADLPAREAELRALVHLYTTLCDPKGLWETAPDAAKVAMAEELPEIAPMKGGGPQVAYEVVNVFKFEPNPNPPPKPKGKKNRVKGPTFEPVKAKFSVVKAPEGWPGAETQAGRFDPSNAFASMTRVLRDDPRLKLGPGVSLRLSLDVRLGAKIKPVDVPEDRTPSFRFGMLTPSKGGYFVNVPVGAAGVCQLGIDAGIDDEVLGGKGGTQMLAASEPNEFPGLQPEAATHCELIVRVGDGGKIELKAVIGGVGTESVVESSETTPAHTDFITGLFALKLAFHETDLLIDNVTVEVGR